MRTLSFILAVAVALMAPSLWGTVDSGLPGPGTFSYYGSSLNAVGPHVVVAAAR